MKLLVTGSKGFMGYSVAQFAASQGHIVLGIAKSEHPADCRLTRYVQADIINSDLSPIVVDFGPDVIFHAAGPASVKLSILSPLEDARASILSWEATLEAIRRSGINPLVIFPSSAAVYGNPLEYPTPETSPIAPISPYGFHKAACELIAREYSECFGLNILVLRFFSLFGARQHRHLIWELYEQMIQKTSTVWLKGTGNESRDYLYIDDAVTAIFALIEKQSQLQKDGCHQVINVASGRAVKIFDVAEQLRQLVTPKTSLQCRGMQLPGDPERTCAEIALLRSLIPSWRSRPLASGLSECVSAWKKGAGL